MSAPEKDGVDVVIVGAGPVGLMCAYLGQLRGLSTVVVDKSAAPLERGRADALNARTLQLLEVAGLFDEIYPLGKPCNTSSVWADGKFVSRQSAWWEQLEGCFHKHFLMLGQSHLEKLLDRKLAGLGAPVRRSTTVKNVRITAEGCVTTLDDGEKIRSRYVIGADGSRSLVRELFGIPFDIVRPQLTWAVIDGVVDTDFPKVPEIIVFQAETSDVAWIPREGELDRFYVRMDTPEFTFQGALDKINRAMRPHALSFRRVDWFSRFSVKESVAGSFSVADRVFLVGDACHIHSVNGGQGLNTGLADAFNLMWKLSLASKSRSAPDLLRSYEAERQPVARSVIEASGELVRSTKFSPNGTHARDYVEIVRKRAGNITGMGIRYGTEGLAGTRLLDGEVHEGARATRIYSLLDYRHFTLVLFGDSAASFDPPEGVKVIRVSRKPRERGYWAETTPYANQAVLVRPDAHVEAVIPLNERVEQWA